MKRAAVVQARMGSSRLPGKVLRAIDNESMLKKVIKRLQRATSIEGIIVATTTEELDMVICEECGRLNVPFYRGSTLDVLDRYVETAKVFGLETVVRVTSDCPLIDPDVVDAVTRDHVSSGVDYVSNTQKRSYPRGLDVESISSAALERAWREAPAGYHRVHVTPYIYSNPRKFTIRQVCQKRDLSALRWTVDTEEDLEFIRQVFAHFGKECQPTTSEVLALLEREPGLAAINSHVRQKALEEG